MSVVKVCVGSVMSTWQLPAATGTMLYARHPLPVFCVHVTLEPWQAAPLTTTVFDGCTNVDGTWSVTFGSAQSHAFATVQPDERAIEIESASMAETTRKSARFIPPD